MRIPFGAGESEKTRAKQRKRAENRSSQLFSLAAGEGFEIKILVLFRVIWCLLVPNANDLSAFRCLLIPCRVIQYPSLKGKNKSKLFAHYNK